ncbi:MAG: hypothetical protein H6608_01880 [Flavobacteriales bacterium]|nr:hypothetical protein [Flavobacteriales bacterium]
MNLVSGARASTVLFNFLKSNDQEIKKGKILLPANVCPIVPATIQRCGLEILSHPDSALDTLNEKELSYRRRDKVVMAKTALKAGTRLTEEHLVKKMSGTELGHPHVADFVGRVLKVDLQHNQVLEEKHFQ